MWGAQCMRVAKDSSEVERVELLLGDFWRIMVVVERAPL